MDFAIESPTGANKKPSCVEQCEERSSLQLRVGADASRDPAGDRTDDFGHEVSSVM